MAWNKYYVIVTNQQGVTPESVLIKLGLEAYVADEEVELLDSNKPKTLFIGNFLGNLIIVHPTLPDEFFYKEPSETEKLFVSVFPDSEIAALTENSTVGCFGYAIIGKGRRLRVKNGCDGEVYTDIGELLLEEKEETGEKILAELEEDELAEMREGMSEEEILDSVNFEASWRVPNKISKRYFGETLAYMDVSTVKLIRFKAN